MTHVYDINGSEVPVYDTAGNRVWGPAEVTTPADPGPTEPAAWPFPATTDPLVEMVRPAEWATVYDVGPGQQYTSINAAIAAEKNRRDSLGIRNVGPQDYAVVRIHPGVYDERLGGFSNIALVGVTGDRADVVVSKDMDADDGAVLAPTQSIYVENITFSSTYSVDEVPPPGDTRATVWNSNALQDTTIVFVNVRTVSNNAVLNSCATQPGHRNMHFFYRCRFEKWGLPSQVGTNKFDAPFNVQTGLNVRMPNKPKLGSDILIQDSEAATDCGTLIAGVADLGSGTYDRVAWVGGKLEFDPSWQRAQWYHSHYWSSSEKNYQVHSWYPEGAAFAGEAVLGQDLHTGAPADIDAWYPTGAVGPKPRNFFFPQALDKVGEIPTAAPDGTMQMAPNRWYYIPVGSAEARTWAGAYLNVVSTTGGNLRAGLWRADANRDAPHTWLSLGHVSPLTVGNVSIHRGTYKNARMYPGDQLWVGIMADTPCTVAASSTLTGIGKVYTQDSTSVIANPAPTLLAVGPAPAPVVKTGVV